MTEKKIESEISEEKEKDANKDQEIRQPNIMAVLPLRDIVVFPYMIVPLFVGREKSVCALEEVTKNHSKILLVSQKDASVEDPTEKDVYSFGTIATILQLLKLPDGTVKVLVEGFNVPRSRNLLIMKLFLRQRLSLLKKRRMMTRRLMS